MPTISLKGIYRSRFTKAGRQTRLENRLIKKRTKEEKKYEKYAAYQAEDERIRKLQAEINSYKAMRKGGKHKGKKVKIGGYVFRI